MSAALSVADAGAPPVEPCSKPPSALTVVVTRPVRDAQPWVAALVKVGHTALALPLMAFGPPPQPSALRACLARVPSFQALMFVSPQAVHAFWGEWADAHPALPCPATQAVSALFGDAADGQVRTPRCWAPGPGTARALLAAGVPERCIDQPAHDATQFDSEALWQVVQPSVQTGDRVLLVRGSTPEAGAASGSGGTGRDWLGAQCQSKGAHVETAVAYSRAAPVWDEVQKAQAHQACGATHVWLLTSSESAGHLARLMPGHDWSGTQALATHPRIADAAAALGFGRVLHSRPALADVLQTLKDAAHLPCAPAVPPKMAASP